MSEQRNEKESLTRENASEANQLPGKEENMDVSTNWFEREAFFVVCLGASAGGLETLEQFFAHMPPDSGMSFVIVVHLDPTHKTLLPELLARYTRMEVCTAEEGMAVEPNKVYVIPANRDMTINSGQLHLEEPQAPRGMRHTIDIFLRSLATDMGENAIAVILSGTGTDGTQGVKAVKEAGGIVVVQEEASAKYPGMPQSAIATGVADLVLPTPKIPEKILEIAHRSILLSKRKEAAPAKQITEQLKSIFRIVNSRIGYDFSSYKISTLMRRIERRMTVNDISDIAGYIKFLIEKPEESRALFKEFLIGVTSFFRDSGAFDAFEQKVVPHLCEDRDPNDPLRVWLAGCSTGEEAYTVAILIREYLRKHRLDVKVQIFASDIDGEAIDFARNGLYPDSIGADVSVERLRNFFQKKDSTYNVVKSIREMIVFAQHNVIKDPPFSRLDLLICRNLLIYLNPDLQKRLLPLFAQALKPNGFLFLGTSETVGGFTDLFKPVDKKWKIFQLQQSGKRLGIEFPIITFRTPITESEPVKVRPESSISPGMWAEKMLMQRYSPPCVVINEKFEIIYFSTRTSRYLEPPVGEPTHNILKMAKDELRPALRAAIHKALSEQQVTIYQGLKLVTEIGEETLELRVEPITQPLSAKGLALVIFEPSELVKHAEMPIKTGSREPLKKDVINQNQMVQQLEEQLRITNEQLQSTVEQMETANEELKSSNEELMSMNEEFQSTNEELETSKEELQALNEELVTVNAELQNKVDELSQANADLQNFLAGTDIATIFLDRQFQVKRFSPAMAKLFNLIISDIGRPLQHFSGTINYHELQSDVKRVLEKLTPIEREISNPEKKIYYMVRILPYRTIEDVINGVVVTFIDITTRKLLEEERQRERNLLESIMQTTDVMLVYLDMEFNFVLVNQAYAKTCQMKSEDMIGKNHFTLYPDTENEAIFRQVRDTGEPVFFKDKPFYFPDQPERGTTYWDWSLVPVHGTDGTIIGLVFSLRETTKYKSLELALRESEKRFRAFMDNSPTIAWMKDEEGRHVYLNKTYERKFNVQLANWEGKTDVELWPQEIAENFRKNDLAVLEQGVPLEFVEEAPIPDGEIRTWWNFKFPVTDEAGRRYVGGIGLDASERYAAEKALRESENMVRTILDSVDEGFIVIDPDYRILTANKPFFKQVGLSEEEVIGKKCHKIIHKVHAPCSSAQQQCAVYDVFHTGKPQTCTHTHFTNDGKNIYVETKAYPLKNAEGRIISVIEAICDVTEKRLLEEERLKSQKLQSLGTLAGGIAHDFNNLLQGIFGYINFAKSAYDQKDKFLNYLEKAEGALNQTVGLTRQLLTFSKGGKPLKQLMTIIPAIENATRFALSGAQTDYRLLVPNTPWPLEADEGQLMQVFQNLIINAREAMSGSGTIGITIDNVTVAPETVIGIPKGGKFLRIAIKDSGIGIAEENISRIFDPYFTTKSDGSGLGLATVFSIVNNHGGTVQVQSIKNQGTAFVVYLPATEAVVPTPNDTAFTGGLDRKGRILLMDDEKMIRDLASNMLKRCGHEAVCVADGQEAIDQYAAAIEAGTPFDMVILDLTVKGGMGGIETIGRLYDIDPNVVAVVSSGYSDNDAVANYKLHGFQAILNKPYRIEELNECVQALIAK